MKASTPKLSRLSDLREALLDKEAHGARVAFCRTVSKELLEAGNVLAVFGLPIEEPERQAIGILLQMAGELASSTVHLFERSRWYAGAALVRQLIEIEYLFFVFSEDFAEPSRWLKSDQKQLRALYRPAEMRRRSGGRFSDSEYQVHCIRGGRPNPRGAELLPERPMLLGTRRAQWADLGQHLDRLLQHLASTLALHGLDTIHRVTTALDRVRKASERWHHYDPCAQFLPRLEDDRPHPLGWWSWEEVTEDGSR